MPTSGTTADVNVILQTLNQNLKVLGDIEAPLYSRYAGGSALNTSTDGKFEWLSKTLKGQKDTVNTAIASAGTTTLVVNSGTSSGLKQYITDTEAKTYIIVRNVGTGAEEIMKVTANTPSTNTSSLTVVRGALGTTALSAIPANSEVRLLPATVGEASDITGNHAEYSSKLYNYIQDFHASIILSERMQNANSVAQETTLKRQLAERSAVILKQVQTAFIGGQRFSGTGEASKPLTLSGGLKWWANDQGNSTFKGNSALTFKDLDTIAIQMMNNGVMNSNLDLILSPAQAQRLHALKEARIVGGGVQQSNNTMTNYMGRYEFTPDYGFNLMMSTDLFDDELIILDKSRVMISQQKAGEFLKADPLAKSGNYDQTFIRGALGFKVQSPKETLFHLKGLAV
jgi:hypothetical protein